MLSTPRYGPGLSPMLSIFTREGAVGSNFSTSAAVTSGASPATNRAFYFPVILPVSGMAYKFWWLNGATASTNNVQVGVYADTGAYKPGAAIKLGTATLASGANVVQYDNITDTPMGPGLVWLAVHINGTTATLFKAANFVLRATRAYEESSLTGGLPSTATPVQVTTPFFAMFGIQFRSSP